MNMLWFLFAGIFNLPDLLAGMQVYTPTEMNNDPQRVWFFDISTSRCSLRAVGQAVARQRIGVIPASYQVSLFRKGTSLSGGTLKGSDPNVLNRISSFSIKFCHMWKQFLFANLPGKTDNICLLRIHRNQIKYFHVYLQENIKQSFLHLINKQISCHYFYLQHKGFVLQKKLLFTLSVAKTIS